MREDKHVIPPDCRNEMFFKENSALVYGRHAMRNQLQSAQAPSTVVVFLFFSRCTIQVGFDARFLRFFAHCYLVSSPLDGVFRDLQSFGLARAIP